METLLIPLSNAFNGLFLLVIMAVAWYRLTDGRHYNYIERASLVLICIGAFFQLSAVHNPEGASMDLLTLRFGTALFMVNHAYRFVAKWLP